MPSRDEEHQSKVLPKRQFTKVTLWRFRQQLRQRKSPLITLLSLCERIVFLRNLTRPRPFGNRRSDIAGFGPMARQNFWMRLFELGELLVDCARN